MYTAPDYWKDFTDIADVNAFRVEAITAHDGYRLDVYECGDADKPVCLLIPPPCSAFLLLSRLALQLSREYRVIGWETRGSPYIEQHKQAWSFGFDDFRKDITTIVKAKGIKQANLVAWCEGFALLPHFASIRSLTINAVANITPSTSYKRHQTAIAQANDKLATAITGDDVEAARKAFNDFLILRDMALRNMSDREKLTARLLSIPMQSFEWARQFATVARGFHAAGSMRKNEKFANNHMSLFVVCLDDKIINYKSTLTFFSKLQQGKLLMPRVGGHSYLLHQTADLAADILHFFRDQDRLRA